MEPSPDAYRSDLLAAAVGRQYVPSVLSAAFATDTGVELIGPSESVMAFARDLGSGRSLSVELSTRAPLPYDASLTSIRLCHSDGPLLLRIEGTQLLVTGDRAALALLAQNLEEFAGDTASTERGAHLHVEWFPGNDHVAEDSEPLVVRLV